MTSRIHYSAFRWYACFLLSGLSLATNLLAQTPPRVTLLDGDTVQFYERHSLDGPSPGAYYAPFNLRIATSRNGDPEFSFLAYRQDSTSAIIGGILHFLLTWGPTPEQDAELTDLLHLRTDSSRYVAGSLPLDHDPERTGLEIGPPDHPLAKLLRRSLRSAPGPPLTAGGKMAASFSFTAADARRMAELMADPAAWNDVYLRIHLRPFAGHYRPSTPFLFTLTKSFASCLESL